ncbi:MAG: DUF1549 domain-containing protein [Myxococcota bacterium]
MLALIATSLLFFVGCSGDDAEFEASDPADGPGQMVGNSGPVTAGDFPGGADAIPTARETSPPDGGTLPDCGAECLSYCDSLELSNPVNAGLCPSLWGVGLSHHEIDKTQACRRVYADMAGRFPTSQEAAECRDKPWDETVSSLLDSDDFVLVNQRFWADKLLYNNESVSIVRIYDADNLVEKLYRGRVPYDQFAAVISAHPVLTRRYSTAGDRSEALFWLLMGRPPLGNERSDLARLYNLWDNGYYDHEELGMRLPDAFIEYECLTDDGQINDETKGECTSILWGYNELILRPDIRAEGDDGDKRMWSGQLRTDEWEKLQAPGRILSQQRAFWEKAVDDVLEQYLGYELGTQVPEVRDQLVEYFLEHNADMRSLHYAVATSVAYRQSAFGDTESPYRWTYGPIKQVHAETWIDSIEQATGYDLAKCDHRLPETRDLERSDRLSALALLQNSRWELDDDGEVRNDYRQLAQSLGGCPRNDVGGRFKIISILTTAQQLNFVNQVCDPALESGNGVDAAQLLPPDINRDKAVDADTAASIVNFQTRKFLGRAPTSSELENARGYGEECARSVCNAEEFARPACFAMLSSSEMLFY